MYEEKDEIEIPAVNKKGAVKAKKLIVLVLILLVLAGGGFFLVQKSSKARAVLGVKPKTEQEAVSRYLAQLGKLMIIPEGDTPVLATVEDPEALIKQQAFFQGSLKGDVVLIFPKSSRAVLYSPTRDLIVNAGPVIQGNQNQ